MRLNEDFYRQDALTVAQELLGKFIVRETDGQRMKAKIVETEAYLGPEDKGCHAYQNKKTARTEVMFKQGGVAYVYLIYGLHNLFNVVVNDKKPEAVLIRAVEPRQGLEMMKENRKIKSNKDLDLTNGPGKLTEALDIDRRFNDYDLISGDKLYLTSEQSNDFQILSSKRINIDYAEEYKDKPWRFYIKGSQFTSV